MTKNTFFTLFVATLLLSACQTNDLVKDPLNEADAMQQVTDEPAMDEATAVEDEIVENEAMDAQKEAEMMEDALEAEQAMDKDMEGEPDISLEIMAKEWKFTPGSITVKEGDVVDLSITGSDADYGFSLPDFGVIRQISSGQTEVVRFIADQKGTFSFTCGTYCGEEHSDMTGTLIVE